MEVFVVHSFCILLTENRTLHPFHLSGSFLECHQFLVPSCISRHKRVSCRLVGCEFFCTEVLVGVPETLRSLWIIWVSINQVLASLKINTESTLKRCFELQEGMMIITPKVSISLRGVIFFWRFGGAVGWVVNCMVWHSKRPKLKV